MTERVRLSRSNSERQRGRRGGRRPGAGRKFGSTTEVKRVARAVARRTGSGKLPDELLREWADTGFMEYVRASGKRVVVELEPADRIACAKGSASYYKAPYQARPAPGERPPVVRLELDEKMVAALAAKSPEKLDVLRDVLRAIQAGGGPVMQAAEPAGAADPERYARLLSETSDVAGSA